jgi:iron complex transport system substrate-binding protein
MKSIRRHLSYVFLALGFSMLSAQLSSAHALDQPMSLVDDKGRTVVLVRKPARVVTLSAHLTAMAVEAGLENQLVGVDSHSALNRPGLVRLSAYPEPSIENLAKLKPNLVFVWGAGLKPGIVSRLEALGIRVFISEPRALPDIVATYELFLRLSLDAPADAQEKITRYKRLLQGRLYEKLVPVFAQVWSEPLMTVGRKTFISSALEHCGADLLLAPLNHRSAVINPEAVVTSATRAIVSSDIDAAQAYWAKRAANRAQRWTYISVPETSLSQPSTKLLDSLPVLCERLDSLR